MDFIIHRKYATAAVVAAAALLCVACQAGPAAYQASNGLFQKVPSAQAIGEQNHGLTGARGLVPCAGLASTPLVAGTPLPNYVPHARSVGAFAPQAGANYLYIADEYGSQIDIFPAAGRNRPQVGTITSGVELPYGIWFDRGTQSLYVANQSNSTVTAYPYGSTQPSLTYSQDLNRPLFPIVDRHGDLFVSNANTGAVVEYLAGSTNAYQVLQTPGVEADGIAFDHRGNLYVAYRTCPSGDGSIEKFAPGSTQGHVIGMTLSDPQGIAVDYRGNIIVDETGTASNRITQIEVFAPGGKSPSLVVPMPGGDLPIELLIDCDQKNLYVAGLFSGSVFGASYPLTGQSFFVKDQVSAIVQGTTMTNNLEL